MARRNIIGRYDLSGFSRTVRICPEAAGSHKIRFLKRTGSDGGVSFQFPPGWDDGSGKVKHVKSGPFKGRVCFTSRQEAKEIAARYAGKSGDWARYDPD